MYFVVEEIIVVFQTKVNMYFPEKTGLHAGGYLL